MKKLSILIYILPFILLLHENLLAANDKQKHFWISAMLGAGSETYLHHETDLEPPAGLFMGTLIGTLPGLAKELIDSSKEDNYFSRSDLAADVAGAFAGAAACTIFNNTFLMTAKDDKISLWLTYSF